MSGCWIYASWRARASQRVSTATVVMGVVAEGPGVPPPLPARCALAGWPAPRSRLCLRVPLTRWWVGGRPRRPQRVRPPQGPASCVGLSLGRVTPTRPPGLLLLLLLLLAGVNATTYATGRGLLRALEADIRGAGLACRLQTLGVRQHAHTATCTCTCTCAAAFACSAVVSACCCCCARTDLSLPNPLVQAALCDHALPLSAQ